MLDTRQPGELPKLLIVERDLARARLATLAGGAGTDAAFAATIQGLRELGTPYALAHGLLDHAAYLKRAGDSEAARSAIEEAREIAQRLRCQPLLERAAAMTGAKESVVRA